MRDCYVDINNEFILTFNHFTYLHKKLFTTANSPTITYKSARIYTN